MPATGPVTAATSAERPIIFGGLDTTGIERSWRAIGEPTPAGRSGRVAVVYPGADTTGSLGSAGPMEPWMVMLLADIGRDATLREAARTARPGAPRAERVPLVVNAALERVVEADAREGTLRLYLLADAGSLTSAALNQAVVRAMAPALRAAERDTGRIADATLAQWERQPAPVGGGASDQTDGRWFWILALSLLALETLMRSRKRTETGSVSIEAAPVDRAA